MAWIGAVIGGAASLVGNMMSSSSAQDQTAANNATQIQLAQQNRDWMTTMSNTAEQRHVQDLKAAGLNPALAYQTPAPVPGSAPIANTQALPPSGVGAGVAGASTAIAQAIQFEQQKAQIQKVNADADNVRADTAAKLATNPFAGATAQQTLSNLEEQQGVLRFQANKLAQEYNITTNMNPLQMQQLRQNTEFQGKIQDLQTQLARVDIQRQQLGMPKMQNDANAQGTWWMKNVAPFLPSMLAPADFGVNSAVKIGGLIK